MATLPNLTGLGFAFHEVLATGVFGKKSASGEVIFPDANDI